MCWSLTFQGFSWLGSTKNWPDLPEIVEQHIVVFYQTVRLLQKLRDSGSNVNAYDKETLGKVSWTWSNKWTSVQNRIFKIPGIETAKKKSKGMFSLIGPTKQGFQVENSCFRKGISTRSHGPIHNGTWMGTIL